ncbi:hypothetical protein [Nesterenkonia haasae]|uniref:hypothetical protein n=1 Tax=Nesterenkonia haasae TaxID=2587813 RepID=UPI001390AC10|nr:hypothetical protein [Nesterenkonia haasae]NDK30872.1 hypothetical protein [Nesterenkonia haasae]
MRRPERKPAGVDGGANPTPEQARALLAAIPAQPKHELGVADHICVGATVILAMASGLIALTGHPWWAVIPAVASSTGAFAWIAHRQARVNEPRLRAVLLPCLFAAWLSLPIWRGITRGETVPFPESMIFAGLAPAAWLGFYLWLQLRR